MGKPFAKSSFIHGSERREREERWANKSEQTKNPEKMPNLSESERADQARRHDEAKAYYRDLKKHGYKRPDAPPADWENRPSREEIDKKFDRPRHVQEMTESKEDLRFGSRPALSFSSLSSFTSSVRENCEYQAQKDKEEYQRDTENCCVM